MQAYHKSGGRRLPEEIVEKLKKDPAALVAEFKEELASNTTKEERQQIVRDLREANDPGRPAYKSSGFVKFVKDKFRIDDSTPAAQTEPKKQFHEYTKLEQDAMDDAIALVIGQIRKLNDPKNGAIKDKELATVVRRVVQKLDTQPELMKTALREDMAAPLTPDDLKMLVRAHKGEITLPHTNDDKYKTKEFAQCIENLDRATNTGPESRVNPTGTGKRSKG